MNIEKRYSVKVVKSWQKLGYIEGVLVNDGL